MNGTNNLQTTLAPGNRNDGGPLERFLRRLIETLRLFFSRLFAKKHPADFEDETGSWQSPDVNLSAGGGGPIPQPLIIRDCNKGVLVYCAVINNVEACTAAEKAAALAQADGQVLTYFQTQFECRNEDCIKKVADLVWSGTRCFNNPTSACGAVLRRFRCEVEL